MRQNTNSVALFSMVHENIQMGIINRYKRPITGFLLLVIGSALAIAYNNCGKPHDSANISTQLDSYENKEVFLIAQFQGKLESNFCYNSANYSCVHKIFSKNLNYQDMGKNHSLCVNLLQGGQVCPEVQQFSYNSQAAQSACQENCQESYEYEEYDCHLKLGSVARVFPLIVTDDNLSRAIEKLNRSCLRIQEGNK